jgi:glutamyl-tRNA reductase
LHYLIISFNHKNTNIDTREKLAYNSDLEIEQSLKKIIDCNYINEAIILSTCNRVEITTMVTDIQKAKETIFDHLHTKSNIDINELYERANILENENAVYHIFSVVSSLDSLVVGETQIAGQFKDAYKFSFERGFCSIKLSRLATFGAKCAKEVRNATNLGAGSVSVASAAVSWAKEIYKDKPNTKALVIGAGEMSRLTIKHLLKANFEVTIISRNIKKANILADSFEESVKVQEYKNLEQFLNTFELLFSATAAPYPIIKQDMVKNVNFTRHWFDIALPRDIDNISSSNLTIYAVDDLKTIVEKNLHLRAEQAKIAYKIVKNMTKEFYVWLNSLGVEPLIKQIHLNAKEIIDCKVQKAIKKKYISKDMEENIKILCNNIVKKLLHTPSYNLRKLSTNENFDDFITDFRDIFNLVEQEDKIEYCKRGNNAS